MMTLYLVFEALETGALTLDTPMKVSAYAAARPPTKLGVKAGSTLAVKEAIPALITRSANDAAMVIAEHLGGSEARFAEMMTAKAHQLGMAQTTFKNPHGLPDRKRDHRVRHGQARAGAARAFSEPLQLFPDQVVLVPGHDDPTHNNLLKRSEIYDGIKTGYTNASGFNIVTSVSSEGRRLLVVVFGGRSARSRDDYVASLVAAYLPKASTQRSGPLVAGFAPRFKGPSVRPHMAAVPPAVPFPTAKPDVAASRIAQAFADGAGRAVAEAGRGGSSHDPVRAAILQALRDEPRPRGGPFAPSTMKALAQTGPQRPAGMPGASEALSGAAGTWDVQIAVTPSEATARQMLADVRTRLKDAAFEAAGRSPSNA